MSVTLGANGFCSLMMLIIAICYHPFKPKLCVEQVHSKVTWLGPTFLVPESDVFLISALFIREVFHLFGNICRNGEARRMKRFRDSFSSFSAYSEPMMLILVLERRASGTYELGISVIVCKHEFESMWIDKDGQATSS